MEVEINELDQRVYTYTLSENNHKYNLKLLRQYCWRQKTPQVMGIPLFLDEGKAFVVLRIPKQIITTAPQPWKMNSLGSLWTDSNYTS